MISVYQPYAFVRKVIFNTKYFCSVIGKCFLSATALIELCPVFGVNSDRLEFGGKISQEVSVEVYAAWRGSSWIHS